MKTTEKRSAPEKRYVAAEYQIRQAESGKWKLSGYASVFGPRALLGWFTESVDSEFFADVLRGDTRFLFDHDSAFVMGRTTRDNTRLSVDSHGLHVDSEISDTARNRDWVVDPMQRGDIDQMSFGFLLPEPGTGVKGDDWDETVKPPHRTLLRAAELPDVSVVAFPAYPQTEIALRSAPNVEAAERSFAAWREGRSPVEVAPVEILAAQALMRAEAGL